MFELPDEKLFRDVIHGYIRIPQCFVDNIIDTAMFQRLRNIDQTGMRILFPDAKHDRFGHSLGVFHLGTQAVDALLKNLRRNHEEGTFKYWSYKKGIPPDTYWAKNKVLFLIACLLHDIGHAPFSHSLENEMHSNSGGKNFDKTLAKELSEASYEDLVKQNSSPHEKMGVYTILKHFKNPIREILEHLKEEKYPKSHQSMPTGNSEADETYVNAGTIEEDVIFVARMVLGLKYTEHKTEKQIRNCFIELLNGNNFDVDKLDYIMRDTQVSGVKNISIDAERLLSAIDIVTLTEITNEIEECFEKRTLIQSLKSKGKDAVLNLKGYVDGSIIVKNGSIVKMRSNTIVRELRKSGDEDSKITTHVENIKAEFHRIDEHSQVFFDSSDVLLSHEDGNGVICENKNRTSVTCNIQNTRIETEFCFTVSNGNYLLALKGFCNIEINGEYVSEAPIVIDKSAENANGEITLKNSSISIVDDRLKGKRSNKSKYNSFAVGFKKSAVSNISAVLDARDFLYKWIYAHHKVVYYANFLIPVIAQAPEIMSQLFCPTVDNEGKTQEPREIKIDDAFIWSHIKERYSPEMENAEGINKLIYEIVNRKYKKSLFKSLPEYDVLFERLSPKQKRMMNDRFKDAVISNDASVSPVAHTLYLDENRIVYETPISEYSAGFVSRSLIDAILKEDSEKISNLVWISAQYKEKRLNLYSTFLIYKDATTTLNRIDLLSNSIAQPNIDTSHYFYLYFDVRDGEEEEKVRKILSEAVAKWGKSLIKQTC